MIRSERVNNMECGFCMTLGVVYHIQHAVIHERFAQSSSSCIHCTYVCMPPPPPPHRQVLRPQSLSKVRSGNSYPVNKRHWPNAGVMSAQRRRRWANIIPALSQCTFFWVQIEDTASHLRFILLLCVSSTSIQYYIYSGQQPYYYIN